MDNKPIYKTAAELGIEQWEHDGLVALVGPLSRDNLQIDYGSFWATTEIVCIGCNVARRAGFSRFQAEQYVRNNSPWNDGGLAHLYWEGGRPSAPQAARAIVNFLVTGDPQWDQVMSEPA